MTEREFAYQALMRLRQGGYQAWWAGGCVRDLLMGIEASDYDIATSAQPQQVREIFGQSRTLAVGAAFGVIIVLSPDRKNQVEVATFRTDSTYSDGRHPDSITFSTPEMDAQRRDFTINGLFYDPIAEQVIDYVGGQEDLKRGILRAIGNPDARIGEDKLRMLRAIRFAARFQLEIEPDTYRAIQRHAAEAASISGERLAVELQKTLETERAAWAIKQLQDCCLLGVLLPEVSSVWPERRERILQMQELATKNESWRSRLAVLLWSALDDKALLALPGLQSRLRVANELVDELAFTWKQQRQLESAHRRAWSEIQPLLISPWIDSACKLLSTRIEMREAPVESLDVINARLAWPAERLNPQPLITGEKLLQLGYRAGPQFKHILHAIRCWQLDNDIQDTGQAMLWLAQQFPSR